MCVYGVVPGVRTGTRSGRPARVSRQAKIFFIKEVTLRDKKELG